MSFENNNINVNDLYGGTSNILNFTLVGPDGSELKNQTIDIKAGNYYIKNAFWNSTTESYNAKFDDLYDLILYSDDIFG